MTKSDIGDYLEQTLENRESHYAIMVMRNAEAVPPTKMGWFHEFDRQRLCVVLSEEPDADPDWRFLRFAYNWARARVAQAQVDEIDDVDLDVVNDELQALEDRLEDFETIRNSARTITEEANDIVSQVNKLELRIDDHFRELKRELGVTDSPTDSSEAES
jgi:hypothetical protein